MIKRLRLRFILVALLSVLVVLSATIFAINVYNYSKVNREAQRSLVKAVNQISRYYDAPPDPMGGGNPNGGSNPQGGGQQGGQGWGWEDMYDESLYREHYFIVCFDAEGNIDDSKSRYNGIFANSYDPNTGQYINNQDAYKELATKVYTSKSKSGSSSNNLWYIREQRSSGTYMAFIDATDRLNNFRTFLVTSIGISAISYSVLAGLIIVASFFTFRTSVESYKKQKAFITNASHELKTPLTIINTDVEILKMDHGENEWTDSITDQVRRLTTMTNQLVTLSKLDEDSMKNYPLSNISLSEVAKESTNAFAPTFEKNGFTFSSDVDDGLTIKGNRNLINELFYIFMDNALKYAKAKGEVNLSVKKNKNHVEINFSNDIEDDEIDINQLFERFYRSPHSNKKEGSGIGLSIAKEIVDLHKAKISASIKNKKIYFIIVFQK